MKKTVYIVHHVDTEGPLHEGLSELFKRIELIFKLKLAPTIQNLDDLRNGKYGKNSDEKHEIQKVVGVHSLSFKRNWSEVDEMLHRILSMDFRCRHRDSRGNGWIYNWHIMDHVGFITNQRHRDIGYLNIFNHYEEILNSTRSFDDPIEWHCHPVGFSRAAHIPATKYDTSFHWIHQSLCRRIIDKHYFPVVNRPGFHSVRPDSASFLEQWFPFDASNQSISNEKHQNFQADIGHGRFGDWRGAPDDWSLYQPDFLDWRRPGKSRRIVSRVLNLNARHCAIDEEEICKAFITAQEKGASYLGVTNHDWREMSSEIEGFRNLLVAAIKKYPDVDICYSTAVNAFRNVLGFTENEIKSNTIKLEAEIKNERLEVNVIKGELFGAQPYLAIKTLNGDYFHDNFDFQESRRSFSYIFDDYTIKQDLIEAIGIAANDIYGNSIVKTLFFQKNPESNTMKWSEHYRYQI